MGILDAAPDILAILLTTGALVSLTLSTYQLDGHGSECGMGILDGQYKLTGCQLAVLMTATTQRLAYLEELAAHLTQEQREDAGLVGWLDSEILMVRDTLSVLHT